MNWLESKLEREQFRCDCETVKDDGARTDTERRLARKVLDLLDAFETTQLLANDYDRQGYSIVANQMRIALGLPTQREGNERLRKALAQLCDGIISESEGKR